MRVNHRESELENHDSAASITTCRGCCSAGGCSVGGGGRPGRAGMITLGACAADTANPAATPGSDGAPSGAPSGGPGGGPPGGGRPGGGGAPPESGDTSDTANGELPEETAGPYPGDGSNGANVLTESGIVRSDITSSFGSSTTRAEASR